MFMAARALRGHVKRTAGTGVRMLRPSGRPDASKLEVFMKESGKMLADVGTVTGIRGAEKSDDSDLTHMFIFLPSNTS